MKRKIVSTKCANRSRILSRPAEISALESRTLFAAAPILQINAAGSAVGSFAADQYYSTGTLTASTANPIDTSNVANAAPAAVYQTVRYGANFSYTLPAPAGSVQDVRLHFDDSFDTAAGQRLFNVTINGTPVLTNFDVIKDAGAVNRADVKDFNTTAAANGTITVAFAGVAGASDGNAIINGIELYPVATPVAPPAVVDLLVPYTAAAAAAVGGQAKLVTEITQDVADMNLELSNSQINETLRLVGTMQTTFSDLPAGITADFNVLPGITDIAAMKAKLGADVVDLWVGAASAEAAGIATEPTSLTVADPTRGYAVQAPGENLMIHEVGHVLGAMHYRGADPTTDGYLTSYQYGYTVPAGNGTYDTGTDEQANTGGHIYYYSNPNVLFRGAPTGVPDNSPTAADNAGVMNQVASLVASYSPTIVPDTVPPLGGLGQVIGASERNSFTFDVTYYDQGGVDVTSLGNNNIQVSGPNGFSANATLSGVFVDGNLIPVSASTLDSSVETAVYSVNTPAAPANLAMYNFSVNANQVKDVVGNAMPAAALLSNSGDVSNQPSARPLPRTAGPSFGTALELGDLAGQNFKVTDSTSSFLDETSTSTYRFSLSAAANATITLTPGFDFGLYQDKNGNGVPDAGESIAPPATGIYQLPAGSDYYLRVQPSWNGTTQSVGPGGVLTLGMNALTTMQPIPASASFSGVVFQDNNFDGIQQSTEPGLAGVVVQMTGTNTNGNPVSISATTDNTGTYTFSNLVPSNATGYTVTFVQPAGYPVGNLIGGTPNFATVQPTGNNGISGVTIGANINATGYSYGVPPKPVPASISGAVFNDVIPNFKPDPGEGIAGVPVMLSGTSSLGTAVSLNTATAADGTYSFTNVPPSDPTGYALSIMAPPAYNGKGSVQGTGASNAGLSVSNDSITQILLQAGGTAINYNFARQAAAAGQTAPTAGGTTVTTTQGQTTTGNVLNGANPGATGATTTLRIDAGGGAVGNFSADAGFALGKTYATTSTVSTAGVANAAPASVYKTQRVGPLINYTLAGVPNASYTVRLHFAELTDTAAGQRLFGLDINYNTVLTNFDVFADAGGANKADVKDFPATADGRGNILLNFYASLTAPDGNAIINGIELIPSTTGGTMTAMSLQLGTADTLAAHTGKASRLTKNQSLMYAGLEVAPKHALSFTLNPDGTFTYVPDPNFYGKDTFQYICIMKATDRCSNSAGPVTIIVRHKDQAPTASTEASPSLNAFQGVPLSIDLRSYVTDTDSKMSSLKFKALSSEDGVLKLGRDGHTVTFTPTASFTGQTTIQFKATDGIKTSGSITLNIVVASINQTLSVPDESVITKVGKPLLVDVLSHTIDTVAGANVTLSIVSRPTQGTAKIFRNKLYYHPSSHKNKTDSITYSVTDNFGNSQSGTLSISID